MKKDKPTILIAEDEPIVRDFLKRLLSKNGFSTVEAEDGKVAMELYNDDSLKIEIIVSDLRMPNVGGIELAKFNYENKMLPFVACTAIADAKVALDLLKFGVQDYCVKPIDKKTFMGAVKNAIKRGRIHSYSEDESGPYEGNVGEIEIPSKLMELQRASNWISNRVKDVMDKKERGRFVNYVGEFLINAHEHGNLEIGEEKKVKLIQDDKFEVELELREMNNKTKISIGLSVFKDEISVSIADEGNGFEYDKYLNMSEETLLERLEMPSGRGIYIATSYFDSIVFTNGGSNALLTKKLG